MEDTNYEEVPNFSIEIEGLSANPSPLKTHKIKEEEVRFATLSEGDLQDILTERHSKATKKSTNWSVGTFNGKGFFLICLK